MSELLTFVTVHERRNWRAVTEFGSGAFAFGTGLWRTTIGEPTAEGRTAGTATANDFVDVLVRCADCR